MTNKLKSLFGFKEYLIEIAWDDGEKEIARMKAWSPMKAITKVKKTKDVINKAEISILNQPSFGRVRYSSIEGKITGVAMKKTK